MHRSAALAMIITFVAPDICVQADDTPAYAILDAGAERLRHDFNQAQGSVRLLFVVDPVCPGCLRGLDDVNRSLLEGTDDPRLKTFVVHVPVIGAEAKDVAPATKLLQNPNVRHYWNPDGSFGRELSQAVGLESHGEPVYAWDVWLIYGPEARWDGLLPPKPVLLMHQLSALQDGTEFPHLDSGAFADEVHRLLAQLPPAVSTP